MRIRLNLRWLLVPALLFSLQFCRAHDLTFSFGGTNGLPLWDLSGFYSLNLPIQEPNGASITVSVGVNMIEDAAGNLHGAINDVQEMTLDENSSFAVTYTITGKVSGSDLSPVAHFVIHFVGTSDQSSEPQGRINATLLVDAAIDSDFLTLDPIKPVRFMATLPKTSVRGIVAPFSDFSIPLPSGEDGTWTLTLQFDTFNRVVGSAIVTTPSQSLGLNLFGIFKNGEYKLRAIGARDVPNTLSGVGSTATIFYSDLTGAIDGLNGKIMGQRLSF